MSRDRCLESLDAVLLLAIAAILVVVPCSWAQDTYKTLHTFTGTSGGGGPDSGVTFDQVGNLYGAAGYGGRNGCPDECGLIYELTPNGNGTWRERVLYRFCSQENCADGFYPVSRLIFDQSGNLYGETYFGGGPPNCDCGVVFELMPSGNSWTEKVLYHFTGGADGGLPIGGLIFDSAGNLYGTTYIGTGYGVVFELTPNMDGTWSETVLYSFVNPVRGAGPEGGVIFDQVGNLYGTTVFGGDLSCAIGGAGCGVVFELSPNGNGGWDEEVLHTFNNGEGGGYPGAALIFDQAGNLYGTTEEGGNLNQCVGIGCGVVFQLVPGAKGHWTEKVLHHFTGGRDGGQSTAALVFDEAGDLYGTTTVGGDLKDCVVNHEPGGCGVVFKLVPNANGGWHETVLHRFHGEPGAEPASGVIFDALGNIYGTTPGDGISSSGSVFEIMP